VLQRLDAAAALQYAMPLFDAPATINVKQPGFRAQKSIADDDAAMPGKERGRVALVPRSSTTPGASNFGWRADRAFDVS
jgi:hypothetical protein